MKKSLSLVSVIFILLSVSSCSTGYVVENDGVYYESWNESSGQLHKLIQGADPKTFIKFKFDEYGKDKNLVYYQGKPLIYADAATFTAIGEWYAKDKFRGYYAGDSILSSTGINFKIIDSYYSTDGKDVFHTTKPLHVCNTKNFKFVYTDEKNTWERWTTDGCYYYFREYKIPSEDYKNVQLFKDVGGFAKDKKWVYYLDRKINFDKNGKKIIENVDVETFQVTDFLECRDKYGCINPYSGREDCKK